MSGGPRYRNAIRRGPGVGFPELAARYLEEYLDKIGLALAGLDEDQLWWRPDPGSNAVGNLLLHLRGNLSQWVLEGLGGVACERHRTGEFAADRSHGRDELLEGLAQTVAAAAAVARSLDGAGLARRTEVQGYPCDGLGILFHAVEHMSYHTGQILWIAKRLQPGGGFELYPQHRGE